MQLTYEQLGKAIESMTAEEKACPVKMYISFDGELHPDKPIYGCSTRLVRAVDHEKRLEYIISPDGESSDPNQFVVEEFYPEDED